MYSYPCFAHHAKKRNTFARRRTLTPSGDGGGWEAGLGCSREQGVPGAPPYPAEGTPHWAKGYEPFRGTGKRNGGVERSRFMLL